MKNTPTEAQLASIPGLYQTEHIATEDRLVYAHFHLFDSHWFILESDGIDTMFGYCILNGDLLNSGYGYVSLTDLQQINVLGQFEVEFDPYWETKRICEIELIRRGGGIVVDPRDEKNGGDWKWHILQN